MKLNASHANKKELVTGSFQLLFLVYQRWILSQGLLNNIKVLFRWSIPNRDAQEYRYSLGWKLKLSELEAK